jgi:hypothetical protein
MNTKISSTADYDPPGAAKTSIRSFPWAPVQNSGLTSVPRRLAGPDKHSVPRCQQVQIVWPAVGAALIAAIDEDFANAGFAQFAESDFYG